jgi:L-alanine-DL-glutamate epimerase-like enolase superfamily enzyme
MIITDIRAEKIGLELNKPIVISMGTITQGDTVIVKITTDTGICGYGEGAGVSFVTGETPESVMGTINLLRPHLLGINPFSIDHIHSTMDRVIVRNSSAKAALDIALYDIMAKAQGLPLYRLLGGIRNTMETDMTIMIDSPELMADQAEDIVSRGFSMLKVKAGINPYEDIAAIRQIRERVGPGIDIKVDANQGWSVGDSTRILDELYALGVSAVEQPIPYWDLDGLAYIRSKTRLKLMADESCFTPQDAISLIRRQAVDIINIKLMKCGGLYRGMQINTIAESAGVKCMLGCMMESNLAITAGAALVASRSNFVYGDLDSVFHHKGNPRIRGGATASGGILTLSEKPGLGIEVDM